ncbi:hypothetical protein EV13_1049 [Prochlorococcus sp. MIT 0702]|nr:hypothetical protein EV12_1087 [Prochlorococcus sp. MIT 0701]KGG29582.1 hypothetical protein EV13_1049 [Prochlorococcus sp. MIT 0702]KGG36077.1 hypothetical protein EV14_0484 [Prochlorococcus sp. MIT 0703]
MADYAKVLLSHDQVTSEGKLRFFPKTYSSDYEKLVCSP